MDVEITYSASPFRGKKENDYHLSLSKDLNYSTNKLSTVVAKSKSSEGSIMAILGPINYWRLKLVKIQIVLTYTHIDLSRG